MTMIIALTALLLLSDQQAPSAAPAPGSPATFKSSEELLAALLKAVDRGGMTTGAVSNTDQHRINLVRRVKPGAALAHAGNTELHYITEGAGTLVTGGALAKAAGGTAAIENGETRRVKQGDVILIPANTPHWYKDIEGSITYLEVRFVAPAAKR
jgi:mannose-6-phosphate isomerase-like protein (cupin superfamily)